MKMVSVLTWSVLATVGFGLALEAAATGGGFLGFFAWGVAGLLCAAIAVNDYKKLRRCPACRGRVAKAATACRHCGRDF